ncbi:hypothetical protein SEPCBS119000_000664 [Sporothrix epigloea]|uniref:Mucin n=1 Tax=Sporothrix epigloea TaxID=1892477 RepID=A0ABP0D7F4_9PEZI
MRNQLNPSPITGSAGLSPRFLSCRHVKLPSRSGVALGDYRMPSRQTRVQERWPVFGDATLQNETTEAVLGARQRGAASRLTDIHTRPSSTGLVRSVTLARRLRSEAGTAGTLTTSTATDNRVRRVSTKLSPTALDWAPTPNVSTPSPALTYADVARLGHDRPPPPFFVLRKLKDARTSAASTGSVIRRGSKSSSSSSGDSEMADAQRICELLNEAATSDYADALPTQNLTEATTNAQACPSLGRGLTDGLGLLAMSADDEHVVSASFDASFHPDYNGGSLCHTQASQGANSPTLDIAAQGCSLQITPAENASDLGTLSSSARISRFTLERDLLDLLKRAELQQISKSSPSSPVPRINASGIDEHKQNTFSAKSIAPLASLLSESGSNNTSKLLVPYKGVPKRDERGILDYDIIKPRTYNTASNSISIGKSVENTAQKETHQTSEFDKENQHEASWLEEFKSWCARKDIFRGLPRSRYCHPAEIRSRSQDSEAENWATEEAYDR